MHLASRQKAVLTLTALLLIGCFSTHKNFTAHLERPSTVGSAKVKMNGVYFMRPYIRKCSTPVFFYLFPDGNLILEDASGASHVPDNIFWENPEEYFKGLRLPKFGQPGHYFIRDSVITFQFFTVFPGYFFEQNTIELKGKIQNDSTIALTGGFCKRCPRAVYYCFNEGGQMLDKYEYRFYETEVKPDTSILWFKDKKWYKKKVWYRDNPVGHNGIKD